MNRLVNPMNNPVNRLVILIEAANKLHISICIITISIPISICIYLHLYIFQYPCQNIVCIYIYTLDLPSEQHGDHSALFNG